MEAFPTYLFKLLNEIAKNEGFINFKFDITPGSKHGDGFVAMIARVTIKGEKNMKLSELKLICKYPPENEIRRETFGIMPAFKREVYAYKNVLPAFENFQKLKGLNSNSDGWWTFPKCYYSEYDQKTNETAIIMEDLCERSLFMAEDRQSSDYEQTKICMQELGKFHAVSFAMKSQKPDIYDKFKELNDLQVKGMNNPMMHSLMEQNFQKCLTTLELPKEQNVKVKLEEYNEKLWIELANCVSAEIAEPYAIINHSDCWINNVMFKYSANNEIEDINLFDWQFVSYASPALDIIIYFFCSTEKPLRDKHYNELLMVYYDEFSKLLKILGDDPKIVFPFEALKDQLRKVGRYGLGIGFFAIPVLTCDNIPDLDLMAQSLADTTNKNLKIINENCNDKFRERMRGIIFDTIELGYL